MAWRDDLRPASFRGVPFFVREAEGEHGRRTARHEYPSRDLPYHEDMGRKAREVTIEGYVVEPGHIAAANALIDACEQGGPATLVHPWLGEMLAVVTQCRVRFSHDHGGSATFSLIFVESGEQKYPAEAENAVSAVDDAELAAAEAELAQLSAEMDWEVKDYFAEDAALTTTSWVDDVKGSLSHVVEKAQTYAEWARGIQNTVADAQRLVQDPLALGERALGLLDIGNVSGFRSVARWAINVAQGGSPLALLGGGGTMPSWRSYLDLAQWTPKLPPVVGATPSRVAQRKNRDTFTRFVRGAATGQAARAAVREKFETYDDAIVARDTIADLLEDQAAAATTDASYRATTALRAKVVRSIGALAPTLPLTVSYVPRATLPALVVAQNLYGDDPTVIVAREAAVVSRNRAIRHPLFVPGGSPIRVITTT